MELQFVDWGLVPYLEAWERQSRWFGEALCAKAEGRPAANRVVFCEHPPAYTLGRNGSEGNMLLGTEALRRIGAACYRVDRGGDITFHGPGQLVCYPILDLESLRLGLKEYVHRLEEAVAEVCASYGLEAGQVKDATGVWTGGATGRERKVCAIGVRSSRFVTMHGLALNVNTDLRYFSYIHPCGFTDRGVTSLRQELGREVPLGEAKARLRAALERRLVKK